MNRKLLLSCGFVFIAILGYGYFTSQKSVFNFFQRSSVEKSVAVPDDITSKFEYLSKHGNSSCSLAFKNSIHSMADDERLRGSCCSPMSLHRYSEQVEGLKKYRNISEIPSDPYDVEAGLAKKLMDYYDMELTPDEQKAYDYAMENSSEKGPCCCKCWRWYVYGGLGRYLIKNYGFTREQVTEVWNLSDGCGGDEEHHHA